MAPFGNDTCCTRPLLSSVLAALALAMFCGAICLGVYAGDEEKCDCRGGHCCTESTSDDHCADDECFCLLEFFTGGDVCRKKETELSRVEAMLCLILIMLSIGLAVASSISCCCLAKKESVAYRIVYQRTFASSIPSSPYNEVRN